MLVQPLREDTKPSFQSTSGISALNTENTFLPYQTEQGREYYQQQQQQPAQQQQQQPAQHESEQQQVKYSHVPKADLHALYGKYPRRKVIVAGNYHTWHDSGQGHMLKWTSIFVCPMTGELFCSGRYFGAIATTTLTAAANSRPLPLLWFAKKTQSEHAAAARAFDCLVYRDHARTAAADSGLQSLPVTPTIGLEKPYLESHAVYALPDHGIPSDFRQTILAQQEEIRRINGLGGLNSLS